MLFLITSAEHTFLPDLVPVDLLILNYHQPSAPAHLPIMCSSHMKQFNTPWKSHGLSHLYLCLCKYHLLWTPFFPTNLSFSRSRGKAWSLLEIGFSLLYLLIALGDKQHRLWSKMLGFVLWFCHLLALTLGKQHNFCTPVSSHIKQE